MNADFEGVGWTCTERFAGGRTYTAVFGASDSERKLLIYGEGLKLLGYEPFVGYREGIIDGIPCKWPKFGAFVAVEKDGTLP